MNEAVIGFGCSAAAIATTYPLETLSRQFHVTSRNTATSSTLIKAMATQGITSFYKGMGPALITQPLYWALYMPVYSALKQVCSQNLGWSMNQSAIVSGWTAGAIGTIVTNPLWVVRQRMQTEIVRGRGAPVTYPVIVARLWRENGAKTFFRGTTITMVKNVQMAGLMPLFEFWTNSARSGEGVWAAAAGVVGITTVSAIAAGSAKIVSSTGVYPLDVLRTNIRFHEGKSVTFAGVARELLSRPGGALNLFRGIGWYWASSAATFAVMMTLQESLKKQ